MTHSSIAESNHFFIVQDVTEIVQLDSVNGSSYITPHNSFTNISNGTHEILLKDSFNGSSSQMEDIVMILSTIIASVGIVANFTVITVFLNHKKLRRKIPNIFIINQVSQILPPPSTLFGRCIQRWPL